MSTPKYNKLHAKRVLVLGGTSGIGYAIAEACTEHGAYVTIASSTSTRLTAALSTLSKAYPAAETEGRIAGTTCDVSDTATVEENLRSLLSFATSNGTHKLDHVTTTAGTAPGLTPLADFKADQAFKSATARYVTGLLLGKLAPAFMNPGPGSSITFTGGSTANKPPPGWSTSAGLGAAMQGAVRGLAIDLAPVRVNLVGLGVVDTPLLQGIPLEPEALKALYRSFAVDNLLNVVGKPEDVAEAYLYFMRDAFVTGQVLLTDGGRLLASPRMSAWGSEEQRKEA